uniref:Uncharacterized protein n=1 Tax=Phytophthora fragariae TaxID=53985 RepID=A0A6A3EL26_9STRA|nr:hypothetical protein PF009_g15849 [Phytophthora fragariae]
MVSLGNCECSLHVRLRALAASLLTVLAQPRALDCGDLKRRPARSAGVTWHDLQVGVSNCDAGFSAVYQPANVNA